MRASPWDSLATIGPRLAAGSLICVALVTGCQAKEPGTPTGPGSPTAPTNRQPQPQGSIPPQELQEGAEAEVNVASYFSDPDGDQLTYAATSQQTDIASVRASGSVVTVRGESVGSATIVVTATDPANLSATQNFNITVTERAVGVCSRTAQVRDAILEALGVTECASVTRSQLAEIESLDVTDSGLSGLREDDFELLPALTVLRLGSNQLSQLPQNVFSDLPSLDTLDLSNNRLQELPARIFAGLSGLLDLELHNAGLSRLPDGAFSGLSGLQVLGMDANQLSELPPTVFSGLSALQSLDLGSNRLQELPAGVFASLSGLRALALHTNQLSGLPRAVFSDLTGLETLSLSNNRLRELPVSVFAGLSALKELGLEANQLQSLPRGVFVGLSELRRLALAGNPGGPFGLTLRFERTDASSEAPAPATVRLVVAEGAPFSITVPLRVGGGSVSPASVSLPRGDSASQHFTVRQTSVGNPTRVTAARLPAVPDAITGVEIVAPDTLVLFGTTNQPPVATGVIQPLTLNVGSSGTVDAATPFTDPDGDVLTFSAVSSATQVATTSTTGSTVRVVAAAAGTATVTVTATDPGGLTASIPFTVTVVAPTAGLIFRDDFNNASSLDNWELSDVASAEVSGGILRLTNTDDSRWAISGRVLEPPVASWEVRARVGASMDRVLSALSVRPAHGGELDVQLYRLQVRRTVVLVDGDPQTVNYSFQAFYTPKDGDPGWHVFGDLSGMSDAIKDGAGELTEITVRVQDSRLEALAGNETLFSVDTEASDFASSLRGIRAVEFWSYDRVTENPGLLDWIEVNGVPSSRSANADRNSRPMLAHPGFIRDRRAVNEVPGVVCLTRKCP